MDKARYVGNDEGSIVRPMVIAGGMLSDSE
jgi:hypothetical protein